MLSVFLVEDEKIVREGLRDNVPWQECEFEYLGDAPDGEIALPKIRELRPDILITDIKMPFLDGLSLAGMVSRELPGTKIILISGYDSFDFAREAINLHVDQYLLKPITRTSLLRALEKTRERILEERRLQQAYVRRFVGEAREYDRHSRRSLFENLVSGTVPKEELQVQAAQMGLNLLAPGYNLVLFSLQPGAEGLQGVAAVSDLQDTLIGKILDSPRFILFRESFLSYAIVLTGEPETLAEATKACVDMISELCVPQEERLHWYVAVGTPVDSLEKLNGCYAEACRVLVLRHLMTREHVFYPTLLQSYHSHGGALDALDSGAADPMMIQGFVKSARATEVDSFTEEFFDTLGNCVDALMVQHYLALCVRISAVAAIRSLGYDPQPMIAGLPTAPEPINTDNLRDYFVRILHCALEFRETESRKRNADILDNAKNYIETHYADGDFSLNAAADYCKISPNYLSAVFSQRVGCSFVEYLTQKRMEVACKLLRETTKRSGEIAYEVGYKEPRYFSFVFKKTQGCTPREYRAAGDDT